MMIFLNESSLLATTTTTATATLMAMTTTTMPATASTSGLPFNVVSAATAAGSSLAAATAAAAKSFETGLDSGTSPGFSTLERIIIAVIAGILSFLTIAGNVLVMVSFKLDKQLQTISNYFLLSLAGESACFTLSPRFPWMLAWDENSSGRESESEQTVSGDG